MICYYLIFLKMLKVSNLTICGYFLNRKKPRIKIRTRTGPKIDHEDQGRGFSKINFKEIEFKSHDFQISLTTS